jgi:chromosome segregation ATPase
MHELTAMFIPLLRRHHKMRIKLGDLKENIVHLEQEKKLEKDQNETTDRELQELKERQKQLEKQTQNLLTINPQQRLNRRSSWNTSGISTGLLLLFSSMSHSLLLLLSHSLAFSA